LAEAQAQGATGIQVGSIFALCQESGFILDIKDRLIQAFLAGELVVRADGRISPSGYPFRVVELPGSAVDPAMPARPPVCDTAALATPYNKLADGKVGMRCPAEPPESFLKKGGALEDIQGRACLCNGLLAAIGLAQIRRGADGRVQVDLPLITCGEDFGFLHTLGQNGSYPAQEALAYLGL
jgi:NAD(P)H-dependent flavin oxidoreductase YrpB (nitropropane dioxygenase family)